MLWHTLHLHSIARQISFLCTSSWAGCFYLTFLSPTPLINWLKRCKKRCHTFVNSCTLCVTYQKLLLYRNHITAVESSAWQLRYITFRKEQVGLNFPFILSVKLAVVLPWPLVLGGQDSNLRLVSEAGWEGHGFIKSVSLKLRLYRKHVAKGTLATFLKGIHSGDIAAVPLALVCFSFYFILQLGVDKKLLQLPGT